MTATDNLLASRQFYADQCSALRQENERLRAENEVMLANAGSKRSIRSELSEFRASQYGKPDESKRFAAEIDAVHPVNLLDGDLYEHLYIEALDLVGERHAKYDLVDLTYYLLRRAVIAEDELAGLKTNYTFED